MAFACLFLALGAGFQELTSLTVVSFLAFFFLAFLANISRFSELKVGLSGFEAKAVIKEATSTINELRILAKIVASTNLSLVIRSGRFGGYTAEERDAILESTLKVLKEIGVPSNESAAILADWHRIMEFDYVTGILDAASRHASQNRLVTQQFNDDSSELKRFGRHTTAEELQAFLSRHRISIQELDELVLDFEFYQQNKKHRRPAVWYKRTEWCSAKK